MASALTDRHGWSVEHRGLIPGMDRCLALWVVSGSVAVSCGGALPLAHTVTEPFGMVALTIAGTGLVARARLTIRADVDLHPPIAEVREPESEPVASVGAARYRKISEVAS